jgi:hypothetical protein
MFYILRTQPYYRQPEYLLYDDDDYNYDYHGYVETKRREYLEALQQQQRHREYERAVALEKQRHRAQLAALAEREALRKRGPFHQPAAGPSPSFYGHEEPHPSAPERSARRRQPASKSQPPTRSRTDDWQTTSLEELYGIPVEYISQPHVRVGVLRDAIGCTELTRLQQEPADEEEVSELEEEQRERRPTIHPRTARRSTSPEARVARTPRPAKPQTQGHPRPVHTLQKPQSESVRVPITSHSPADVDSDSDSPKRTQALTAIAEIAHIFDTLRRTFTFPPGPLERDPHSSAPRLAYSAQNSVVHAYENALSELLTKLDAVESFGFKAVRDARKELVVNIERELEELERKVVTALGVGEEEKKIEGKVEETMDEEEIEKSIVEVEDVHMEDHPTTTPTKAPMSPEVPASQDEHMEDHESSQPQAESVLNAPANSNIPEPGTTDRAIEPASTSDPIGTYHPIAEEPPATDLGNVQDDGGWTPDCPSIDPTSAEDNVSGCTSGVSLFPQQEGLDHSFEMP